MDQEIGRALQNVDPVDCRLQSAGDVGIRRLIEADMAVADLYEREVLGPRFLLGVCREEAGDRHAARKTPDHSGSGPLHALQKTAAVYAVVFQIIPKQIVLRHVFFLSCHNSKDILSSRRPRALTAHRRR